VPSALCQEVELNIGLVSYRDYECAEAVSTFNKGDHDAMRLAVSREYPVAGNLSNR
jgi:hypothetical protein